MQVGVDVGRATPASVLGRRLPLDGRRHEYVYVACDLFTDVPIAELPLRNVQFSWSIKKPGTFSADLPVPVFSRVRDYMTATTPGRSVVYVFRDGVPIWGGILWKRTLSSGERVVKIEGDTFDSYMYHRILDQDLMFIRDMTKNPPIEGTDQIDMFRVLWDHMSGNRSEYLGGMLGTAQLPPRPNSDIHVLLSPTPRNTVKRGRSFMKWDFRTYGEHLETLAGLKDGFEWYATVAQAPEGSTSISGVDRRIEFAWPRFGRPFLETGFIWEFPANMLSYSWTADADKSATAAYVLGAGEGDLRAYAVLYNQQRLNEGWPLIDVAYTHSTVSSKATMESHAAKYLRAFDPPVGEFDLTVHPDLPPTFGPPGTEQYFMGDEIGIKIEDDIFAGSDVRPEDLYVVIGGITVTPNDDGIEDVKPEITINSRNPYIGPDEEDQSVEETTPTPEVDTGSDSEGLRYLRTSDGTHRAVGTGGWGGSRP
jgi:hypothetical protein